MPYERRIGTCIVPGCEGGKIIAKGLCRHHYDHRYDHYKTTGIMLSIQDMVDHPRRRVPRLKSKSYGGRTTGDFPGTPIPHPEVLDLNDPEVRRHTMVAMSEEDISAKSDTLPAQEKIPLPGMGEFQKAHRPRPSDIKREILIARLEWLHAQVSSTIRELTEI